MAHESVLVNAMQAIAKHGTRERLLHLKRMLAHRADRSEAADSGNGDPLNKEDVLDRIADIEEKVEQFTDELLRLFEEMKALRAVVKKLDDYARNP